MNLSQEIIDKKFSLPKNIKQSTILEKQSVVLPKQSVAYTSYQITKLNLKR